MKVINAAPKIFWLGLAVFALAFAAQRLFVGDVVPIAWAQAPQKLSAVEMALVLLSLEYVGAFVAAIALAMIAARWAAGRMVR
jgi:hypothetical protein